MADYQITFTRSARKELERLDSQILNRIFSKIETLSSNPRPNDCLKLQGEDNLWRVRIGDYRVIYAIYDKKKLVDIMVIRHRRESYN